MNFAEFTDVCGYKVFVNPKYIKRVAEVSDWSDEDTSYTDIIFSDGEKLTVEGALIVVIAKLNGVRNG